MATKIITVAASPPAESSGSDYNKGAPLNATEFDQNLVNLRAAIDRRALASSSNAFTCGALTSSASVSINVGAGYAYTYFNGATDGASVRYAKLGKNYDSPYNFNIHASSSSSECDLNIYSSLSTKVATFSSTGLAITGDVSVSTKTPASAGAAGVAGTITWDGSYIYVCTATNTWKRVAIATW